MKSLKYLLQVLLLTAMFSCSSDDGVENNDNNNFVSQQCNSVSGPTAIYWDYTNNLATPLNQVPLIANPGQQFVHSQLPLLGFTMPQGYQANEILVQQTATIGVNVVRNDNAVVWRYIPSSTFKGAFNITDVMAFEINQMFNFYGFNGNFEVLCTNTKNLNHNGIQTTFSARLIRFGNFIGLVRVNTHFLQGLGNTYVTSLVSAAPTNEFDSIVMNTFLPISWQLIPGGGGEKDSDLDGTPDDKDKFPNDPTRQ